VAQGFLRREGTQYPVLRLTDTSRSLLRGACEVRLMRAPAREGDDLLRRDASWSGVDQTLFDELREWRKREADSRGVSPDVILGDTTLRHLAAARPSSIDRMRSISGIGEERMAALGPALLAVILESCAKSGATLDAAASPPPLSRQPKTVTPSRSQAYDAFRRGTLIDDVVKLTGRARSTIAGYLADFIITERPPRIDQWIEREEMESIAPVVARLGTERLKPIYDEFEGRMSYDVIKLVVAHVVTQRAMAPARTRHGDSVS